MRHVAGDEFWLFVAMFLLGRKYAYLDVETNGLYVPNTSGVALLSDARCVLLLLLLRLLLLLLLLAACCLMTNLMMATMATSE